VSNISTHLMPPVTADTIQERRRSVQSLPHNSRATRRAVANAALTPLRLPPSTTRGIINHTHSPNNTTPLTTHILSLAGSRERIGSQKVASLPTTPVRAWQDDKKDLLTPYLEKRASQKLDPSALLFDYEDKIQAEKKKAGMREQHYFLFCF